MRRSLRTPFAILLTVCAATAAAAQTRPAPTVTTDGILQSRRPIPGAVYESAPFTKAVARGTRTRTGVPGVRNWVQHARYTISASLDNSRNTIRGTEHVVYLNNSPDTLSYLMIHLRQNVFRADAERGDLAPLSSGMQVTRRESADISKWTVDGTVMRADLKRPLLPHDSVTFEMDWWYVPAITPSDGREGRDEDLYIAGYWYPQVAVYDDVDGWVADQYVLSAEFYMDPADYDVHVTVPRGWVVGATGTLLNADSILSGSARAKLALARRTGSVETISRPDDNAAAFAVDSPTVTWHFSAPDVRDFAWGTSNRYVWDATRALVSDAGQRQDTVNIYSFYRLTPAASAWAIGGARYTRDAIEQMSKYLWRYPWPSMTSMEGVLTSGGMEYPRITVMQPWADTMSLAGDLMHETGHMWFPMQVGSNETRYTWMDEGLTQFNEAQGMRALYGEPRKGGRIADTSIGQRLLYLRVAASGNDQVLMRRGDQFPPEFYNVIFYDKTAQVLGALRGIVGDSTFHRAFREYGLHWIDRHPHPEDFFNAMDAAAGRNLSWFWNTWFYNAWPLDQAIGSVVTKAGTTTITIEDRGLAPMPVKLAVTRANGVVQRIDVPVDVWLKGARSYTVRVAASPSVVRVVIDPDELFPDVNRDNQAWSKTR